MLTATFCWDRYRRGDAGRRVRVRLADCGSPRIGDPLRSVGLGVCSSEVVDVVSLISRNPRLGNPGKTSSTGFLGVRIRFGEPRGLEER
jgi:hypothetical protein